MPTFEDLETIEGIAKTGVTLLDTNCLYLRAKDGGTIVDVLYTCERLKDVPYDSLDSNLRYTQLLRRIIERGNMFFVNGVCNELEKFLGAFNGSSRYLSGRAEKRKHVNEKVLRINGFRDGVKSLLKCVQNHDVDVCFKGERRGKFREIKGILYGKSEELKLKGNEGDYENHTDEDIAAAAFLLYFVNNGVTNVVSLDRHVKSLIRFLFEDGLKDFRSFVSDLQPAEANGRKLELHGYKEGSLCCLEKY